MGDPSLGFEDISERYFLIIWGEGSYFVLCLFVLFCVFCNDFDSSSYSSQSSAPSPPPFPGPGSKLFPFTQHRGAGNPGLCSGEACNLVEPQTPATAGPVKRPGALWAPWALGRAGSGKESLTMTAGPRAPRGEPAGPASAGKDRVFLPPGTAHLQLWNSHLH